MTTNQINISILEDHQGIIDGYLYRLTGVEKLKIAGIGRYGEELKQILANNPTDVLILDIEIPISPANSNPYPVLNAIPQLKQKYPHLAILVISSHTQQVLVERLFELGVSGCIFKNDHAAIEHLAEIIAGIHRGGVYFSQGAYEKLRSLKSEESHPLLTPRQLEALSLCVAFPDSSTLELAKRLGVSNSTFRNLLSTAYKRLGVRTRIAAIAELQRMGIGISNFNSEIIPKA
ncbi:MAG TPA: response regulator transcription factor [Anaerolineales bacterium]